MDPAATSESLLKQMGLNSDALCDGARMAAENAGQVIRETLQTQGLERIRNTREAKHDGSPVSAIDRAAHESVSKDLLNLANFPLVSEEDPNGPMSIDEIPDGSFFWIVDPLDGTRDLLAGESTFAVAIALMRKLDATELSDSKMGRAHPYLGVIHDPSGERTWSAVRFGRLRKWEKGGETGLPAKRSAKQPTGQDSQNGIRVLGSRSIPSDRLQELYRFWGAETVLRMGSAIKFALIAEGSYDIYPRFGPTCEWDTAAGQVMLEVTGGGLVPISVPILPMPYGKPDWVNSGFLAARTQALLTTWVPVVSQKLRD